MSKERHAFDRSSKWLIQKHGDSLLFLGGVAGIKSWRALQAELVQPQRLPDGLLEVTFRDRDEVDYFLLEIATYPERRISEQALNDLTLAYQQLRVLPELLTVVLAPKGILSATGHHEVKSRLNWSRLTCSWRIIELWTIPASELLEAGQVGLLPWVPLTQFSGPPAPLIEKCRRQN